jgi:quinolinate synthase
MCGDDVPHQSCASLLEFSRLAAGSPVNIIEVDATTTRDALVALNRMLEVK